MSKDSKKGVGGMAGFKKAAKAKKAASKVMVEVTSQVPHSDQRPEPPPIGQPDRAPANKSETSSAWPQPRPLDRKGAKAFPLEALPSFGAEFARAAAREVRTSTDIAAMGVLAALSASLAGKVRVNLNGGNFWQPLNLYLVVAAPPGDGKGAFGMAYQPVREFQNSEQKRLEPEIAEANASLEIDRALLKKLKEQASKDDDKAANARARALELERTLAGRAQIFMPELVMRADATEEGIRNTLAEQGGVLAILDDEGAALFDRLRRYSPEGQGANIEALLNCFDGTPLESTRAKNKIRVPSALLTIGLAVQREALANMVKAGQGRGLVERGLFSLPNQLQLEDLERDPPTIPMEVEDRYKRGLKQLLTIARPKIGEKPPRLDLAHQAREAFLDFRSDLDRKRFKGSLSQSPLLTSYAKKFDAKLGRLAALLHLVERAGTQDFWGEPVTLSSMTKAAELSRYFLDHILSAAEVMEDDQATADARLILSWFDQQPKKLEAFKSGDLARGPKVLRGERERRNAALEVLEAHDLIKIERDKRDRPSQVVVNPKRRSVAAQSSLSSPPGQLVKPDANPTSDPVIGTFDTASCPVAGDPPVGGDEGLDCPMCGSPAAPDAGICDDCSQAEKEMEAPGAAS